MLCWRRRQSGLKTGYVVGLGLKIGGVVDHKNSSGAPSRLQVWGYHPRKYFFTLSSYVVGLESLSDGHGKFSPQVPILRRISQLGQTHPWHKFNIYLIVCKSFYLWKYNFWKAYSCHTPLHHRIWKRFMENPRPPSQNIGAATHTPSPRIDAYVYVLMTMIGLLLQ